MGQPDVLEPVSLAGHAPPSTCLEGSNSQIPPPPLPFIAREGFERSFVSPRHPRCSHALTSLIEIFSSHPSVTLAPLARSSSFVVIKLFPLLPSESVFINYGSLTRTGYCFAPGGACGVDGTLIVLVMATDLLQSHSPYLQRFATSYHDDRRPGHSHDIPCWIASSFFCTRALVLPFLPHHARMLGSLSTIIMTRAPLGSKTPQLSHLQVLNDPVVLFNRFFLPRGVEAARHANKPDDFVSNRHSQIPTPPQIGITNWITSLLTPLALLPSQRASVL